jgi:hypothetical protein
MKRWNQGNYSRNCELLLTHIYGLNKGRVGKCVATTKYLAKTINKSIAQTERYLKTLKDNNLIKIETSLLKTTKFRKKYKLRNIITSCQSVPEKTKEILNIHFNKRITKETKVELTQDILKSNNLKYAKIIDYNKKAKKEINKLLDQKTTNKMNSEEKQQILEIVAQDKKELQEKKVQKEFNRLQEKEIQQILLRVCGSASHDLIGDTWYDKLISWSIQNYRNNEIQSELYGFYSDSQKAQRLQTLAKNTVLKDGVYMITIFLAGQVPYELNLFNYVPWDRDSETFLKFEKMFKELNDGKL